jgi:pimeloyl-ACP methyl ester carboxylesterase
MIDVGSGPPLVLIPGIQGRWEWMRPTVAALARQWRVITSSLPGEPGIPSPPAGDSSFDGFVEHVDALVDARGIRDAVVCGVSFGGLIALRYAARRPTRVRALILVSTPGPQWKPAAHQQRQIQRPILSSPAFTVGAAYRSWRELSATYPDVRARLKFCAAAVPRVLTSPPSPRRMGLRARMAMTERFDQDCANVKVPTLVVTGDADLDKVVVPEDSRRYVTSISGAQLQVLERTGHLGTISAPERFAAIVSEFLNG